MPALIRHFLVQGFLWYSLSMTTFSGQGGIEMRQMGWYSALRLFRNGTGYSGNECRLMTGGTQKRLDNLSVSMLQRCWEHPIQRLLKVLPILRLSCRHSHAPFLSSHPSSFTAEFFSPFGRAVVNRPPPTHPANKIIGSLQNGISQEAISFPGCPQIPAIVTLLSSLWDHHRNSGSEIFYFIDRESETWGSPLNFICICPSILFCWLP